MKAAIYARVSIFDQESENQLAELRRYAAARGWSATAYVDKGVSGAKDKRAVLDQLPVDVRRCRLTCWWRAAGSAHTPCIVQRSAWLTAQKSGLLAGNGTS